MMKRGLGWLIVGLAISCGAPPRRMVLVPSPSQASEAHPENASVRSVPVAGEARPAASARQFRFAWAVRAKPQNKALVFAPDDSLVLLAGRELSVVNPRTGATLATREVCFTFRGALGFADDSTVVVVCEDSIKRFSFPSLQYQGERDLPALARVASFGQSSLALAFEGAPVRIFDLGDWRELSAIPMDQTVSALALSADGQHLAIGLAQGELLVHALPSGSHRRISVRRGEALDALVFSRDGKRLFASSRGISAIWRIPDLVIDRSFRAVRGVRSAVWFARSEVATAGSDGLLLLRPHTGAARSIGGGRIQRALSLAVPASGRALCAADRGGLLVCFDRGRAAAELRQGPPLKARPSITRGRVLGREGRTLRIKAHHGTFLPPVGVQVAILKYGEVRRGEVTDASWSRVVAGRVVEVRRDVVRVRVAPDALKKLRVKKNGLEPLYYDVAVKLVVEP